MATYASNLVQLIFKGVPITGFMDDSFLDVERNADSFALLVGADGEVARAAQADKSGKITFRLLQTSASNDFLSAALVVDEATNANQGPVMVKDGSGRSVGASSEAWIVKPAKKVYAKGIEGREWVIECGKLIVNVAGN